MSSTSPRTACPPCSAPPGSSACSNAREALYPYLDANERTVGAEIEIRHLAPTPLGANVTCLARVIASEGTSVTFHVEARDEHEVIARGLHKRGVIRVESFAKRVARKTKAS